MAYRDYQKTAIENSIRHIRQCKESFLVVIGTGGGKSHILAGIAEEYLKICKAKGIKRKVLITAPKAEIITENYKKYVAYGYKANIYSASLNRKELKHDVTFGSPLSIINAISDFEDYYGLVLIDEPRNVTPTLRRCLEVLKNKNPALRIGGVTATPFTKQTGFVAEIDENGKKIREAIDPFFKKIVCNFDLTYLIKNGWNLPPVFSETSLQGHYNTTFKKNHSKAEENKAFEGKSEKTQSCMLDIIEKSKQRHSVLIFAQTKQHAQECAQVLPESSYKIITDDTKNRARIIEAFERFEFKYLINITILGVGTNIPCVDCIAIIRYTESIDLLIQIIGRGTRKYLESDNETPKKYPDGTIKNDFLVLDYTDNFKSHFPDGDFYNPKITAPKPKKEALKISAVCEKCNSENFFPQRPNPEKYLISKHGYFSLLNGKEIEIEISKRFLKIPAHYGRRCESQHLNKKTGLYERCDYRWSFKECPKCEADNDIAARYCEKCGFELVNPDNKLNLKHSTMIDEYAPIVAEVLNIKFIRQPKKTKGNFLRIQVLTKSGEWINHTAFSSKDALITRLDIKGSMNDSNFWQQVEQLPKKAQYISYRKSVKNPKYNEILDIKFR